MSVRARSIVIGLTTVSVVALTVVLVTGNGEPLSDLISGADDPMTTVAASDDDNVRAPAFVASLEDDPAPPPGFAPLEGTDTSTADPATDPAVQDYVEKTRAVLVREAAQVDAILSVVTTALRTGSTAELSGLYAPDEPGAEEAVARMIADRPPIARTERVRTISVFAVGAATVYMPAVSVVWTDAGLDSAHVVQVPMRFIRDKWYLSGIGPETGALRFVQSVQAW